MELVPVSRRKRQGEEETATHFQGQQSHPSVVSAGRYRQRTFVYLGSSIRRKPVSSMENRDGQRAHSQNRSTGVAHLQDAAGGDVGQTRASAYSVHDFALLLPSPPSSAEYLHRYLTQYLLRRT